MLGFGLLTHLKKYLFECMQVSTHTRATASGSWGQGTFGGSGSLLLPYG